MDSNVYFKNMQGETIGAAPTKPMYISVVSGAGATLLSNLNDVSVQATANAQVLTYVATMGKWANRDLGAISAIATDAIWDAAGDMVVGTGANTAHRMAAGATTTILKGGGAADPVWTTVTGTGAPVCAVSPALTGVPLAPTAAIGTNTTQLSTCEFVMKQTASPSPLAYGVEWAPGVTSSPALARVNQYGATIAPDLTAFNAHPIWGNIRRCMVSDAGVVRYSLILDTGTTTSGGDTTLTNTAKTWKTDEFAGKYIRTLTGTASGQERLITSNTATELTVPTWTVNPDNTTTWRISEASGVDSLGFDLSGASGQIMVQIPKFWYKAEKIGTKYRWVISDRLEAGFKVHPMFVSDGVEKPYVYIGAFQGSVYDVAASATEVNTITVTAEPTSTGNLNITLDGNYVFTVAVADADTIEGVVDKIVAAGNKTDYQSVVWTVSKVDTSNVRYTAGSAGLKTTVTMPTACGVTSTIVKTTSGAGGYVLNDSNGVVFTASTGDKLCSIAGVKPVSGWNNATATLPNFRVIANNRGTGWRLQTFNTVSGIELLYLIEYASFNSQTAIGAGVSAITDATAGVNYNNAINNGYTAGVGTNAVSLGNATGEAALVTHFKTAEAAKAMSYRGIENFYGNIYTWVDGINIKADRMTWIADHDFASDTFTHPYVDSGITNCATSGYTTNIGFNSTLDYGFLASAVGGSSSTYLCDYYYQSIGNRSALFGGNWDIDATGGAFYWYLNYAASIVGRTVGCRLIFIAP